MGYKSFCCLLLLLTGNVSLLAQGIDDISPMAIYNIGLVGCDSIGVNVLKTFISTGEARMRGRIRRKDYFGREHGKRNYIDSR